MGGREDQCIYERSPRWGYIPVLITCYGRITWQWGRLPPILRSVVDQYYYVSRSSCSDGSARFQDDAFLSTYKASFCFRVLSAYPLPSPSYHRPYFHRRFVFGKDLTGCASVMHIPYLPSVSTSSDPYGRAVGGFLYFTSSPRWPWPCTW